MPTILEVYREFASRPDRRLTVADLEARGYRRNHAHVILTRLRASGLAEPIGKGRVRLLQPGEARPPKSPRDILAAELERMGAKATGFSVLPRRYPAPRPTEFIVPSGKVQSVAETVRRRHPERRVVVNAYEPSDRTVCIYRGPVRGRVARLEEALLHVYRHAPEADFALALQAVLQQTTHLDWRWLRRQDEWPQLAGIFMAVNGIAGRDVFPRFHAAEPPRMSYDALEAIAQPFVARGSPGGS